MGVEIVFACTPDGHGRVEPTKFHTPVARLRVHGAELIGEVARYGDHHRLCHLHGPDGIIVAPAEELA